MALFCKISLACINTHIELSGCEVLVYKMFDTTAEYSIDISVLEGNP